VNAPELPHDEAGHGLIHVLFCIRKGHGPQQAFERMHRHHPMQHPRAVFTLDRGGLSGLSSLPHLSHAGFDDVSLNDQPLECAVFADYGHGVRAGWLKALEHLEGWHTLGHVEGASRALWRSTGWSVIVWASRSLACTAPST
jgi:hypothetical protein